ncbi:MAG TPA: protein kinase [Pyrinomonadaceae bacterium]|nr:protein kinase [Pyrinomonadaceae bacterium]
MKAGEDSPDENQATLSSQPTLPAKSSLIGQKLGGRYLIEKELGRGGMGAVYLARDKPELHARPVVVKVLLEEALKNDWVVQKFQQEIESLTRLDDPGVIGIFDAGKLDDGTPYLVMQYVEGSNLRLRLKPEGLNLHEAANIIRQVGRSVTAAHDAGILHRDLKPENIMLRQTATAEQVKIIDFGIAKVTDSVAGVNTATGTAAGTVIYMSPEQLSAKPLTPSSDIYALGVIAYEMVTGRRPFNPESMFQLLEMHRAGVRVKPADLRPGLSADAEAVILKALAFEPVDRYQRAQDFGDQLASALIAESNMGGMTTRKISEAQNPGAPRGDKSSETVLAQPTNPEATKPTQQTLETAHVLFTDIVGYSMLMMDEQTERLQELQEIVRNTQEFQRAQAANQLLRLPTGDGMALSFFGDPEAPVRCAVEISYALKSHPEIKLRMGVHSGLVYRIADINANMNVAGGGINMAQRVMDCGDSGHILLTKRVADDLGQLGRWAGHLRDLGQAEVKHGILVHVYNLVTDEVGNPELPAKLRPSETRKRSNRRPLVIAASALGLVAVILGMFFWKSRIQNGKPTMTADSKTSVNTPEADPVLTYSLTVQKVFDGKPMGGPEEYTGAEMFGNGWKFKFNVTPVADGYLYLLNAAPKPDGVTEWNVLFPTPKNNDGQAKIIGGKKQTFGWYLFDNRPGQEKLWIVWSRQAIAQLDTVVKAAAETGLVITKPQQIATLTDFLQKREAEKPAVSVDEKQRQSVVKSAQATWAYLVQLRHDKY